MKLAILTPNRLQSNLLINNLVKNGFQLELVIYYAPKNRRRLKEELVYWVKEIIKQTLLFNATAQRIKRIKRNQLKQATRSLMDWAKEKHIGESLYRPAIQTENVNSQFVIDELKQHNIDVLLIWGIPVLKPKVIQVVNSLIINAHSSILPEYRGTSAEFWQFVNNDFQHAGITFHQVNSKIDEGNILLQVAADKDDCSTPEMLRMMNAKRVIKNMPVLLAKLLQPVFESIPQSNLASPKTKTFKSKDVTLTELKKVYLSNRR